jgi:hypothetical protein
MVIASSRVFPASFPEGAATPSGIFALPSRGKLSENNLPETGGLIIDTCCCCCAVDDEGPRLGVDGKEGTTSSMLDAMLVGPATTLAVDRASCRSGFALAFNLDGESALIVASESTNVVVALGRETVDDGGEATGLTSAGGGAGGGTTGAAVIAG